MNRLLATLVAVVSPVLVYALEPFVVKDIRVEGLQRVAAGTVFNYLPVKVGDKLTEKAAQEAIRALYKTEFFKDVRLERQGDVLIVSVVERSSIAGIRISGSREFSETDLKKALKELGLAEGRIFNRSLLDRVEQELRSQYFSRGYYAVSIKPTVTPLERNRVDLEIAVTEGPPARIREILPVGNTEFSDKKLLDLFTLGPAPWWALFSSRDQYSKQKLSGDIERVRNFYQDQGYLEFNVESTQVAITPDKEDIYVTVNLAEGKQYTVTDFKLAGKFPVPESELRSLISVKPGATYSRKEVTESSKRISDRLANDGYAFANVNAVPEIDKEKRTVRFTFFVDPGNRVYVRRVNFAGNVSTTDEVLRREMRQLEGAWYSAEQIKRSRERLQRLGIFEDVNIETPAVAGVADQVDLNVTVKERPSGNFMAGIGYSGDGVAVSLSVTETNLFGTGKELSARIDSSPAFTNFNIKYNNPYYTDSGISRGFTVFSNTLEADELETSAYDTKTVGAGVFFGIPLSEYHKLRFGLNYESIEITTKETSAQFAKDFVLNEGSPVDLFVAAVGWSSDSLNESIFPTKGTIQRIDGEIALPGSDLEHYKISYLLGSYWPLSARSTFKAKIEYGFGDGYGESENLPFFKNYFAGGTNSVRGYKSRSLGPRDGSSENRPIGGDRRVIGNLELLFPMPGAAPEDRSMRLGWFVDAGMVYGSGEQLDLGQLRYSTGLAFNWYAPVGPISISYGRPLNDKPGDETESIQFTLGVPFR